MLPIRRQFLPIQFRRPSSGLAFNALQVRPPRRPIRHSLRQGELVPGEGDQLVEAAGRKFPRSVMNSTTCSRSQASSDMA